MWCSSNHLSTPTCACPSAPPPSSATPTVRRDFVCGLASLDVWAGDSGAAPFSCAAQSSAKSEARISVTERRIVVPFGIFFCKRRSADSFAQLITRWQATLAVALVHTPESRFVLSAVALLPFAVVACRAAEGIWRDLMHRRAHPGIVTAASHTLHSASVQTGVPSDSRAATFPESASNVGFVLRMPLPVRQADAREHKGPTDNLRQGQRFTQQKSRHRRGQRALCEQADGRDGRRQMPERVCQRQVTTKLRNQSQPKNRPQGPPVRHAQRNSQRQVDHKKRHRTRSHRQPQEC